MGNNDIIKAAIKTTLICLLLVVLITVSIKYTDDGMPCIFLVTHNAGHGVALCGW